MHTHFARHSFQNNKKRRHRSKQCPFFQWFVFLLFFFYSLAQFVFSEVRAGVPRIPIALIISLKCSLSSIWNAVAIFYCVFWIFHEKWTRIQFQALLTKVERILLFKLYHPFVRMYGTIFAIVDANSQVLWRLINIFYFVSFIGVYLVL